jgi:predicted O-methyltransferase YrrM
MGALGERDPRLGNDLKYAQREAANALAAPYSRYVTTISTRQMAGSLESMALLTVLCERYRPCRILDLGSGFSTYVFCQYAEAVEGVLVRSIDDSAAWLSRTSGFLREEGLAQPRFGGLDDLLSLEDKEFDLVFYDLAVPSARGFWLSRILRSVAVGGLLVVDDLHFDAYRMEVANEVSAAGLRLFSLRAVTLDQFGRFAGLVVACE